ncbi:MAG: hypothetical protein HGA45_02135 [Chloroflexales bacterium]|nr:hypothetical protein [Chloroflexales bacterium]
MGAFEQWSQANLGQAHYVLGYLIVLVLHNWPLFLAIGLCIWWGIRLYRIPSRARVCWFFGALLFGLAYEYSKHIAPTIHGSLDTVLGAELLWLNTPAHFIIGPLMQVLIFGAMAFFLGQALWLEAGAPRGKRAATTSR